MGHSDQLENLQHEDGCVPAFAAGFFPLGGVEIGARKAVDHRALCVR
jgi:hypothetical protein